VIDKNDNPTVPWVLDHWAAVIVMTAPLVLIAVLALVARWGDRRDVEAQEVNYAAGARR
jgi:hypothetical protein